MSRVILSLALLACIATCVHSKPLAFGIDGIVDGLGANYFTMDAEGNEMKVFADANTVFRIETTKVSAAYLVKGTKVNVAGSTDRPGLMNATVVTITPSKDAISGTVKKIDSKFFILETGKESYKVYVAKFTKIVSGKPVAGGTPVIGRRPPVKKEDGSRIKVGAKVDVIPVTNRPDALDAWEINIEAADEEPGTK